jgi:hypothetical protein
MDVFNINAGAGARDHLLNAMLVKLAERSTFSPGSSWRVGVINPIPLQKGHISLGAISQASGQGLREIQHASIVVNLHLDLGYGPSPFRL